MTFADMMQMKRLGETAVSPDGKWLAYSVTTVNLEQNTKTAELWLQAIAGGDPQKLAVAQPGDSGPQFAPDGKRILFESSRNGGQQVWIADFDPATGATGNPKRLTAISTEADNAIWSPDGNSVLFTSAVYPDCPAITTADFGTGDKCNSGRDAALASSKVKAQIFTHLLYRHWNRYTGDKRSHLFLASVDTGSLRDLTPNDPHDVPPFSLDGGGCGCAFAPDSKELAFTENLDEEPAISTNADIFTLDLTNPAAKPVKVSTSQGGDFNPAYSPDGKYLAWRSLTHLNDALLAQLDLPAMESFWFTAADKTKLQGFLIKPPAFDPAKKYPVKFLIHGGPQGAWGDDWSYRWNAELFAANGYVVVMINFRGSTGYGQAIVDGVNGDWGGKPFTDLMTGLDYAEQHYPFIDKTRECALGASYGGYMANWVLGHTDRFKCIVSHDGMFNPESAYGTTEELWFNEWEFKGTPGTTTASPTPKTPTASGPPRSPPKTSRRRRSSSTASSTTASMSAKASSFSPRCSASRSPARCSTSPTKATGSSSRRTRSSGGRPSTTG
jgi:dipeptidyl aminopeptidase/acylaminoacyl peptidase